MFNDTLDLLWIALAVSVIVFTVFFCWGLYYVVQLLKQTNASLQDARAQLNHVSRVLDSADQILQSFRERFAATGAALGTIASAVKFFFEQKSKKSEDDS
ncbi:MAG: hypothetical protein HYZ08_01010 [Candidatus Kerfeldbacteria bacterium]|nr:hypothetical protein [Candidatus Kerfeldbacteria bacterium]